MKKIYIYRKLFVMAFICLFFNVTTISAQTGFEDDVDDVVPEEEAPIDTLLLVGMMAGAFLAYRVLQKDQKIV